MRLRILFTIILSLLYFDSFSQKSDIENMINQIAIKEIPNDFRYYYVFEKSIIVDTSYFCKSCKTKKINNILKNEVLKIDPNIPTEIFNEYVDTVLNWNRYHFKNVKFVSNSSPSYHKKIYTLNRNTNKLDSLIKNKKPQTLFIRRKWFWSKKRVWKEVKKAWKKDEEINIEDKVFYSFSYPIFSSDGNYAKITIEKKYIWNGTRSTFIYRFKNGTWEKVFEYIGMQSKLSVSDINPNGMYAIFKKYEECIK